jgi:hypothetical protein
MTTLKTVPPHLLPLALLVMLLAPWPAVAGLQYDMLEETYALNGESEGARLLRIFVDGQAVRVEAEGEVTIVDLQQLAMYRLDVGAKRYDQTDLRTFGSQLPRIEGQAGQMLESILQQAFQTQIVPTNEFDEVAGYNCQEHVISSLLFNGDYCLSREVVGFDQVRSLGIKAGQALEENPLARQINFPLLMESLAGFPVRSVTRTLDGTVVMTMQQSREKGLQPALFKVPAGYRRVGAP